MLRLLHEFPQREYPVDYLLSRLRYRRVLLQTGGVAGDGTALDRETSALTRSWEQEERYWLFRQMNRDLRRIMAPLFVFFEINTLVQCLRFIEAGRFEAVAPLLDQSLFSSVLKKSLRDRIAAPQVLERIERFFHDTPLAVKGLEKVYRDKGVQGCEEMIRRQFHEQALHNCTDQDMYSFLQDLVDLRNTITMAKCLRWKIESVPVLTAGGRIRIARRPVTEDGLRRVVGRLIMDEGGQIEQLHPVGLEPVLYDALLLKMTRRRRVAGQVVPCIEYILRSHLMVKKQSIQLHAMQGHVEGLSGMETVH